ncbi:MAG TPA: acyl-CoA reductase, partial [Salinimicrobium sp.]|nr:acyl-CoA reductase [Salinimicrobium sp.]
MTIEQRIEKFIQLGEFLGQFDPETEENQHHDQSFSSEMKNRIEQAVHHNGWFTKENILFALKQWSEALTEENLEKWLGPYNLEEVRPKTVGIVMAGNIPLVGFHDFLCVLISGHRVLIKQSSNDLLLLPVISDYLISIAPEWKDFIKFLPQSPAGEKMTNIDAVIATGSNNTARYFEYYFAGKPSIIRKNRNSVAILTGEETEDELKALGEDIFRYYGLGCRNVSKLYVPQSYDFEAFFKAVYPWNPIINHAKYANNYDYNKAVYLMSSFKLLENGFLILKEDNGFGSPIATLFYETFNDPKDLTQLIESSGDQIQCIVAKGQTDDEIYFG